MGRATVKAIFLAGEHPWDASPVGRIIPRALLPVVQSPIAAHTLRLLSRHGVGTATFCVNPASRVLRHYLGDGRRYGVELDYFEDRMPRGPAGCLRDAATFSRADCFLVIEGALVGELDCTRLIAAHLASGAAVTVITGEDPLVAPPPEPLAQPAGVWLFDPAVLTHIAPAGYQDLKEGLIPRLVDAGLEVRALRLEQPLARVRDARSYYAISEWMVRRHSAGRGAYLGYRRTGDSLVHESARLHPSAEVIGPTIIGPQAELGADALVVGPTVIGGHCRVESGGCVLRSVLWDHSVVQAGASVDSSIVTNGAWVTPGDAVVEQVFFPSQLQPLRFSGELRPLESGTRFGAAGA